MRAGEDEEGVVCVCVCGWVGDDGGEDRGYVYVYAALPSPLPSLGRAVYMYM
jgi:hypothetical protein